MAEIAGIHSCTDLLIERHVQDSGCIHQYNMVLIRDLTSLIELGAIKGDGLFA